MVLDEAKAEIDGLTTLVKSGSPGALLEKSVELSVWLASVNEYMADMDHIYRKQVGELIGTDPSLPVSKAEYLAQQAQEYKRYVRSKGLANSIEHAMTSLRRLAAQLAQEQNLQPKSNLWRNINHQ